MRLSLDVSAAVLLACVAVATAAAQDSSLVAPRAWRWDASALLGLSYQGYQSDALDEALLAREAELRVRAVAEERGLAAVLRLSLGEDLYDESAGAGLNLDYARGRLALRTGARLYASQPGLLNAPIFFDPDYAESLIAVSGEYLRGTYFLEAAWTGLRWDSRLRAERGDRRYEEPGSALPDRREDDIEWRLELSLPAGLSLESELGGNAQRYEQRPASDASQWRARLRALLPVGARGQLYLGGGLMERTVDDAAGVAVYEEPGGWRRDATAGLDVFGEAASVSLALAGGREHWDDYDGYYHDGWSAEGELFGSIRPRAALQADLLVQLEAFDPDALPGSDWILRRGRERRLSADLSLRLRPEGEWPLTLGGMAEQMRVRAAGEDRFTVLEGSAALGWRPGGAWAGELRATLDRYLSDLEGEATESEWGVGGGASLSYRRGVWLLEARAQRQRRYTFLADAAPADDWQSGLELRWHP